MIKVKVKLDTARIDRFEKRLLDGADKQLRNFSELVVKTVKDSWYKGRGVSLRHGPPRKVTGMLERSISIDRSSRNRDALGRFISADSARFHTISVSAPYAGRLEYGDLERPFLEPAIDSVSATFPMYMERIARK